MGLLAILEGRSLCVFIGICLLIGGAATFVWSQRVWERHSTAQRVLLLLAEAFLLSAGLMFLGVANFLEPV
jgi:hypothetical protein